MAIHIRDSRDSDLPAVQAIYAHHVLHGLATFEEIPPSVEEMIQRREGLIRANMPQLVAELDGKILGYCYAGPYLARPAYRFAVENSVYIAEGHAGQGLGTRLMTQLIERCSAGPWRQMIGVIGDSGNRASIALHRKLGFQMVGTLHSVGFKLGRWVDTVFMQRALGAGDSSLPGTAFI